MLIELLSLISPIQYSMVTLKSWAPLSFPPPFERRGGYYSDALQSNQPIMLYGTVIDSEYQQHSTKYSWRTAKSADC